MCGADRFLIECGEGTVRQMSVAHQGLQKVSFIWLSHSHIEHYLGLAGFLRCLDLISRNVSISVFTNRETIDCVNDLVRLCNLTSVTVHTHIAENGLFYESNQYAFQAFPLRHSVLSHALIVQEKPSHSFDIEKAVKLGVPEGPERKKLTSGQSIILENGRVIQPGDISGPVRPGRRFVYVSDTEVFDSLVDICRDADLLVCEATYSERNREQARRFQHLTARDAALLARDAQVRSLVLTHISPQEVPSDMEAEARSVFPATMVAEDYTWFDLPRRAVGE